MNTSYRNRLNRAANRAPRITLYCPQLQFAHRLAAIRVKAAVYAANNPRPTAVYTGHVMEA